MIASVSDRSLGSSPMSRCLSTSVLAKSVSSPRTRGSPSCNSRYHPLMAIASTNPATGEVVKVFDAMTDAEVDVRLDRAVAGFEVLRRTSFEQRAVWMRAAADILDAEVDDVARTMTLEMGKTFASAKAEVAKCAKGSRFYAEDRK